MLELKFQFQFQFQYQIKTLMTHQIVGKECNSLFLDAFAIIMLIIWVFGVLFTVLLTRLMAQKLHAKPNTKMIFRIIAISFPISLIISGIGMCSYYMFYILHCKESITYASFEYYASITSIIVYLFYEIGLFLLMVNFYLRLYYTFFNTAFEYSSRVFIFFGILLILTYVLGPIGVTLLIVDGGSVNGDETMATVGTSLFAIHLVLYAIDSFVLVFLFLRCLMSLTKSRNKTNFTMKSHKNELGDAQNNVNISESKQWLDEQQIQMITVVSKYIILVSFAIGSTMIVCVLIVIYIVTQFASISWYLLWTWLIIEYMCNLICLYLQYGFAQKHYWKLCNKLHGVLATKCMKVTVNDYAHQLQIETESSVASQ